MNPMDAVLTRLRVPVLAWLAGVTALLSWQRLVEKPLEYVVPAALIGLAMSLTGVLVRLLLGRRAVPAPGAPANGSGRHLPVVVLAQAATGLVLFGAHYGGRHAILGVIPTRSSLGDLVDTVVTGAHAVNTYTAPVSAQHVAVAAFLVAGGLGILFAVDLLAAGLGRPTLAGVPLLVALMIPISVLNDPIPIVVFVVTALLFLALLRVQGLRELYTWSTTAPEAKTMREHLAGTSRITALAAVSVAILVAAIMPVSSVFAHGRGGGAGFGHGSRNITVVNPFINLRRDLVRSSHTPLLFVRTFDPDTSHVRMTVLDEFTGTQWRPSPRRLLATSTATGTLGLAPGLSAGQAGQRYAWTLQLATSFDSPWLPLPYPVVSVTASDRWRYDTATFDVVHTGDAGVGGMRYQATSFTPTLSLEALRRAGAAPAAVHPMLALPKSVPKAITTQALAVTKGAQSPYDKAVALQDWFRENGGFRYSTATRRGSGMDLLAHFVTDDRVGYCEQYAAAMALMGRILGIPSRVAVGFLDGKLLPDGRTEYTTDDLHAWPEMYFAGYGWVRFEPTPSIRSGQAPTYTQGAGTTPSPAGPSASANPNDRAAPVPRQGRQFPDATIGSKGTAAHGAHPLVWLGGVLALLLLLAGPGAWRRALRQRRLRGDQPLPRLAEGAWAELRASVLDHGLVWSDDRSPRQQARELVGATSPGRERVGELEDLLALVERSRYSAGASHGPAPGDRPAAVVRSWERQLSHTRGRPRALLARVLPASLWRR